MEFKISSLLIGMLIVGLIATGFVLFMNEVNNGYNQENYNSSDFSTFNKQSDINDLTQDIRNKTNVDKDASLFDVIGAYFSAGYSAVKVSAKSVDTMNNLIDTAGEKSGITNINIVTSVLVIILLIIIFVGIFLSLLVKRPM